MGNPHDIITMGKQNMATAVATNARVEEYFWQNLILSTVHDVHRQQLDLEPAIQSIPSSCFQKLASTRGKNILVYNVFLWIPTV